MKDLEKRMRANLIDHLQNAVARKYPESAKQLINALEIKNARERLNAFEEAVKRYEFVVLSWYDAESFQDDSVPALECTWHNLLLCFKKVLKTCA